MFSNISSIPDIIDILFEKYQEPEFRLEIKLLLTWILIMFYAIKINTKIFAVNKDVKNLEAKYAIINNDIKNLNAEHVCISDNIENLGTRYLAIKDGVDILEAKHVKTNKGVNTLEIKYEIIDNDIKIIKNVIQEYRIYYYIEKFNEDDGQLLDDLNIDYILPASARIQPIEDFELYYLETIYEKFKNDTFNYPGIIGNSCRFDNRKFECDITGCFKFFLKDRDVWTILAVYPKCDQWRTPNTYFRGEKINNHEFKLSRSDDSINFKYSQFPIYKL